MVKTIQHADLILTNANVITFDPFEPKANCVVIKEDRIVGVGSKDNLAKPPGGSGTIIDCQGRTVLPGFIDCHFHFPAFAERLVSLDLGPNNDIQSISDIQQIIQKFSKHLPSGKWIRGKGYNEFYLEENRHPNRLDLDQASSEHPIKLTHRSGHAHVLNSLALQSVGISKESPDPPGGMIDRHIETGEPTGLLFEMGAFLSKALPPLENQELEKGAAIANQELLSLGITSIHDATVYNDFERWKLFDSWKNDGLLKSRVNMMLGMDGFDAHRVQNFSSHLSENQLRLGGLKIILDETSGQLIPTQSELNKMVLMAHQLGLQVAIHAIEEKATVSAYSSIEYALKKSPRQDHRHRIEHCSVCPPSLAKKLASKRILVVTQPSFLYYNGERYLKTVPSEQLQYLYPIRTLIKSGVKVVGGSDCPIVPANPFIGIYAAISRRTETGDTVMEREKIDPIDALRLYTRYAAEASFEETIKGTITPGKLADLVVLKGDPTQLPPDEIRDLSVEMTILGGELVWERDN